MSRAGRYPRCITAFEALRKASSPLLSNLSRMGLIPKPSAFRQKGISVMMRVKDEEDWIEASLLSIKDFADEIVVVDSSTDRTSDIIEDVESRFNVNLKRIEYYEPNICEASNLGLRNTHYRWVLRWDGDFVARTSGVHNILNLRHTIMSWNPDIYYAVSFPMICLDGDLRHQLNRNVLQIERWLCCYHPNLRYVRKGRFETLWAPLFFKTVKLGQPFGFHMRSVKSARRLLFRRYWTDWIEENDIKRFPSLENYVQYRIKMDFNTDDMEKASKFALHRLLQELVPYTKQSMANTLNTS